MISFRSLVIPLVLILSLARSAQAETITGQIIGVTDGDSLTLLDSARQTHRIRLAGIDAPEKKQDFGQRAKTNLSTWAFGHSASADCRKRERYQRQICVVRVAGKDVGLAQIRSGLAWWYRQYAREQTPEERLYYEQAEANAETHRLGLWSSSDPVPPWDWRNPKSRDQRSN